MDWRDRVLKLMNERGFKTRNDLCIKAGISAGSLNMALTGTHELKLSTMGKLATALNTTTRWLLYGDEMVEARQVPILDKKQLISYMLTGQEPEDCRHIEIGHNLSFTSQAYAWVNKQDDMSPHLLRDDVLIIDSCDPELIDIYHPCYFMIISGYCDCYSETFSLKECLKSDKIKFYVGKVVNISSDVYFETTSITSDPELFRYPAEGKGDFCIPVGIVVQSIRTLVQH